jgi:hypothetical protein
MLPQRHTGPAAASKRIRRVRLPEQTSRPCAACRGAPAPADPPATLPVDRPSSARGLCRWCSRVPVGGQAAGPASFFIAQEGGWSKEASASGNALGCLTREVPPRPQEGSGDTIYPALPAGMTPSAPPRVGRGAPLGLGSRSSSIGDPPTGPGDLVSYKTTLSSRSAVQSAAPQKARQRGEMPPTQTRDHRSWS